MNVDLRCGEALAVLRTLPAESVHCCVTSPPYWGLRDYGTAEQLGLEATPAEYVARLVGIFREVRRVLRADGTLWLNLGDSYAGAGRGGGVRKQLVGIPWRAAFALQDDGWVLRQDIVWHKPNPMPSSVRDRCTTAHEYVFLLTKNPAYWYDAEAIKEPAVPYARPNCTGPRYAAPGQTDHGGRTATGDARNRRSVWTVTPKPYKGAHFAVMPPALVEPCLLAGCPPSVCTACGAPYVRRVARERVPTRPGRRTKVTGTAIVDGNRDPERHVTVARTVGWEAGCGCGAGCVGGLVLDPFLGSGTVAAVARSLGRRAIGIELNPAYVRLARKRLAETQPPLPFHPVCAPAGPPGTTVGIAGGEEPAGA